MKKGSSLPEYIVCITVLILILSLFYYQGGISKVVGEGLSRDGAKIDKHKIVNSMQMMGSEGTAVKKLGLNNDYDRIKLTSHPEKKLVLEGDFEDSPIEAPLPSRYEIDFGGTDGDGNTGDVAAEDVVCIQKEGKTVRISSTPCELEHCITGYCSSWESEGTPKYGYSCKNGVYTSEKFFERYYHSDKPGCGVSRTGEEFAEVNRVKCPDFVYQDLNYGCYGEATWNCSEAAGDAEISMEGHTKSFECTSHVEHSVLSVKLDEPLGERDVNFSVSTPNRHDWSWGNYTVIPK